MGTGDEEQKKKLKVQHSCTSLVATKQKIIEHWGLLTQYIACFVNVWINFDLIPSFQKP